MNPCSTWIWVHDINHIRFPQIGCYDEEMNWLRPFRYFIVHNKRMELYLRQYINIEKCIHNEVFDYVCRNSLVIRHRQSPVKHIPKIIMPEI